MLADEVVGMMLAAVVVPSGATAAFAVAVVADWPHDCAEALLVNTFCR